MMWRQGFQAEAYVYATAASRCAAYRELPGSRYNPTYGDSLWRGLLNFQPQGWNQVALRVRLNTPGCEDGILHVTVNGESQQFDQMMWREAGNTILSALFFCTFYGGSSSKYACPRNTCIRFKNILLIKYA
jgi:hypothetical protein